MIRRAYRALSRLRIRMRLAVLHGQTEHARELLACDAARLQGCVLEERALLARLAKLEERPPLPTRLAELNRRR